MATKQQLKKAAELLAAESERARDSGYRRHAVSVTNLLMSGFSHTEYTWVAKQASLLSHEKTRITYITTRNEFKISLSD